MNQLNEPLVLKTVTFGIPSSYIPKGLWKSQSNDDHNEEIYYCAGNADRNWYLILEGEYFVHHTTNPDLFIVDIPQDLIDFGLTPDHLIEFSDYNTVKEGDFKVVRDFYDKYNYILNCEEYELYVNEIKSIKTRLRTDFLKMYERYRIIDENAFDPNWRMTALYSQNAHDSYHDEFHHEMTHYEVFYKK
jgi:hypothetical protein